MTARILVVALTCLYLTCGKATDPASNGHTLINGSYSVARMAFGSYSRTDGQENYEEQYAENGDSTLFVSITDDEIVLYRPSGANSDTCYTRSPSTYRISDGRVTFPDPVQVDASYNSRGPNYSVWADCRYSADTLMLIFTFANSYGNDIEANRGTAYLLPWSSQLPSSTWPSSACPPDSTDWAEVFF
jgi:hypothetical protein